MDISIKPLKSTSVEEIRTRCANLKFGRVFTDRMFTARHTQDQGWHDFNLGPYAPLQLDPAANVIHYAQQVFEGLKAYPHADGKVFFFRPADHADRFDRSATRLCMPPFGRERFLAAINNLVDLDRAWIPKAGSGTLYLRPTMIGTEAALGVKVSKEYLFFLIASPVGPYFKGGLKPIKLYVETEYVRASLGGIGSAKSAGNYAASLLPGKRASELGCDQVLFLDAQGHRFLEELGGMNVFCVINGQLVTPPLGGSILPGITRDSILRLAGAMGIEVSERPIAIDELAKGAKDGSVSEMLAVGTAAIVTPIGSLLWQNQTIRIGDDAAGKITKALYDRLTGIQNGELPDQFGWLTPVVPAAK